MIAYHSSWSELCRSIEVADTAAQILCAIEVATTQLGFRYWSFGARPRRALDCDNVAVHSNYPPGGMVRYMSERCGTIDTSISLAYERFTTVDWAEARAAGGRRLWAEAADRGLRFGLAHPAWDRMGTFGLLSVARESDPIGPTEIESIATKLAWIGSLSHAKLCALASGGPDKNVPLSNKELQVLQWTAVGKTASEVAAITGVTTRTVNFHIGNILAKLNATNKIQAAVRATVMGLL